MKKKVKNGNRYCKICWHHLQQKGKYINKTSHRWYVLNIINIQSLIKTKKEEKIYFVVDEIFSIPYTFKENVRIWISSINFLKK